MVPRPTDEDLAAAQRANTRAEADARALHGALIA
jgi:hypothetical protein